MGFALVRHCCRGLVWSTICRKSHTYFWIIDTFPIVYHIFTFARHSMCCLWSFFLYIFCLSFSFFLPLLLTLCRSFVVLLFTSVHTMHYIVKSVVVFSLFHSVNWHVIYTHWTQWQHTIGILLRKCVQPKLIRFNLCTPTNKIASKKKYGNFLFFCENRHHTQLLFATKFDDKKSTILFESTRSLSHLFSTLQCVCVHWPVCRCVTNAQYASWKRMNLIFSFFCVKELA